MTTSRVSLREEDRFELPPPAWNLEKIKQARRDDIKRGAAAVIQLEELADKTWRPALPKRHRMRKELLSKLGPLKTQQWQLRSHPASPVNVSSPAFSPVNRPVSLASFAAVTDMQYLQDIQRRLMFDRFRDHLQDSPDFFNPHDTLVSPTHLPSMPAPKPLNNGRTSQNSLRGGGGKPRLGPTQFQSDTGVVTVMKSPEHALIGTKFDPLRSNLPHYRDIMTQIRKKTNHNIIEEADATDDARGNVLPAAVPVQEVIIKVTKSDKSEVDTSLKSPALPKKKSVKASFGRSSQLGHVEGHLPPIQRVTPRRIGQNPFVKCKDWLEKNFS